MAAHIEAATREPLCGPADQGSLRAYIDLLAATGRLTRITREVNWDLELGEVARQHHAPVLFEKIKDYPGARVFTNGLSDIALIGLALGLGNAKRRNAVVAELRRRQAAPIQPRLLEHGPVQENIVPADNIDLLKLPVPRWHPADAGRYIGTWHVNITKDPFTATRNIGVYRMQILNSKQATVSASVKSNLATHVLNAERKGQALDMAVAIGVSEPIVMAASSACPLEEDELGLAGAFLQRSLGLIKCRTVSIEVPADAEIVIEGRILPGTRVQDGPYFDYAGIPSTNLNAFLFEATQLMFRHNCIFRGTSVGSPGAEDHQLFSVLAATGLLDFHGRRSKQLVQNWLVTRGWFKAFQLPGRWKHTIPKLQ